MALEDFFTVAEMKDGLVVIDRVEELVFAMQKEKDFAVNSVSKTARKWSAVAKALATTKDMGILKHFVRLGGLDFLEQWLKEAQQYSIDNSESSVESTCELLRALEKLVISNETHVFSGIMDSVKNLVGHKSIMVQDRAKALFDLLNQGMEKEFDHTLAEEAGCHDEVQNATITMASSSLEHPATEISSDEVVTNKDGPAIVHLGSELQYPRSSDGSQQETVAVAKIPFSIMQNLSDPFLSQIDEKDAFQRDSQGLSIMSTPFHPRVSIVEDSSKLPVGETSSLGTHSSPVTVESNGKTSITDVVAMKDISSEWEGTKSAEQFVEKELSYTSAETHAQPLKNDFNGKERDSCAKKTLQTCVDSNTSTVVSNPSDAAVEVGLPEHSRSRANLESGDQNDGVYSNVSQDLSVTDCTLRKMENVKTRFRGESNDVEDFALESTIKMGGSEDSATLVDISKPRTDMEASDEIVKSGLDMEVDFVEDDALDVARQVGHDMEREVVDYREPLCSSFSGKKNSESRAVQPGSPDSVNGEQDQPMEEVKPAEQNFTSGVISPKGDDLLSDVKQPEDSACNHDLSQVTEAAQEVAFKKLPHGFDLNEESCSQEMDQPSVIVPSSIIAAATLKASEFVLPGGGSEKAISVEGSSSSKQRPDFLVIDLNVAEEDVDGAGAADPVVLARMPESSGFPSGESSVEVSSKRAMRLDLDLNLAIDNGDQSSSPVSWSSSLDLNHNPSAHQVDGPFISLMGTRVPINREASIITPQTRSLLPNEHVPISLQYGGGVEPQYAMPYVPPYGFNGLGMDPFMPAPYGSAPVPYMVDPRETLMGQGMLGSFMPIPPSYYPRPPFPMSMPNAPSGFSWRGHSQPNLDTSSGFWVENMESGTTSRQAEQMEEQMGMRMKRKEPDTGCDPYPGHARRQPPPWQ